MGTAFSVEALNLSFPTTAAETVCNKRKLFETGIACPAAVKGCCCCNFFSAASGPRFVDGVQGLMS
jgi:hypothetical protein